MTTMKKLRRQLHSLALYRWCNEQGAAAAHLISALVVAVMAVFAVDFLFRLPPTQRAVAILLAALLWLRFAWRRGPKISAQPADVTQTALWLPQQRSDDLVAALQFSAAGDASSGSLPLKQAVVRQVESTPPDVFHGFSWRRFLTSAGLSLLLLAICIVAALAFPLHAAVFLDRLQLGTRQYPQATEITQIAIDGDVVLQRDSGDAAQPQPVRRPQGQPITFAVVTRGEQPEMGTLRLSSANTGASRDVPLRPYSTDARIAELQTALTSVQAARRSAGNTRESADDPQPETTSDASADGPTSAPPASAKPVASPAQAARTALWTVQAELVEHLPNAASTLDDALPLETADAVAWDEIETALRDRIAALEQQPQDQSADETLWRATLARLAEPIDYEVEIGDSRTALGRLEVAEIPIVELETDVRPPDYAAGVAPSPAPSARQFTVLQGSAVRFRVQPLTDAPLEDVRLILSRDSGQQRVVRLQPNPDDPNWATTDDLWLASVGETTRYELQATDIHGYSIASPIRGVIRVRPDRAATAKLQTVHRVLLPEAKPVISFQAQDDFAVAQIVLRALVERAGRDDVTPLPAGVSADEISPDGNSGRANSADNSAETESALTPAVERVIYDRLALKDDLPVSGAYTLDLAPLQLQKGDRLKLTAEVLDYRGQRRGRRATSEPLLLEISDESGVLSAISEPDERSEQRLDDLIRRQLGIGDDP